ncbi:MAG: MBL fold metallo-hydrolase [Clostridia bacterium]|jgi:competence protein ComEC|nr:MBL fold metallo-hydrolase [Clostridia bacterium]
MSRQVEMVFWDVQHGYATYVKTPNNRHIVIDLGTGDYSGSNAGFSPLKHLKANYGITQLDYVIITHPHRDHIDDILNFDSLSPKVLWRPTALTNDEVMAGVQEKDKAKFQKYCEINNGYNAAISSDSYDNPDKPDNWGGVSIKRFSTSNCDHNNFNNFSAITVFEYAGSKIVIPGDNESASFEVLMKESGFVSTVQNADILLAPHHGRESGYYADFVNKVNPRISIVSDGRYCDTSANARYSQKSRGWTVHKRDGTSSTRKCLTTNSDGAVTVKFGYQNDNSLFLYVAIE